VAEQALQTEKTAHREAAATWSNEQQEMRVELATLRERAAGAEQRATDLGERLRRQEEQAEREIARLREEQATTAATLRQLEAGLAATRAEADGKPQASRAARGKKPSE
jgi:chromosome segregation ATPase